MLRSAKIMHFAEMEVEMLKTNETAKLLCEALGIDSLAGLDLSEAEIKRMLSQFRSSVRAANARRRRHRPSFAGHTVLYAVDESRLSFALHHGMLPGCVCKCRMTDADTGRVDAMDCHYAQSSIEVLD